MKKNRKIWFGFALVLIVVVVAIGISAVIANELARKEYGLDLVTVDFFENETKPTEIELVTDAMEEVVPPEMIVNTCNDWNLLRSENVMVGYGVNEQSGLAYGSAEYTLIPMVPLLKEGILAIQSAQSDVKLVYFDEEKKVISAELVGSTEAILCQSPSGAAYISVCVWSENYDNVILVENDHNGAKIVRDKSGVYSSVKSAVDSIEKRGAVIIFPGVYVGNVKCWGKEVYLIGANKEECVMECSSSSYYAPPIEMSAGLLKNLTIRAKGAYSSESAGAYAIHVEDNDLMDKSLLIDNCDISSTSNSAVGMGMRGGCKVSIIDSTLTGREFGLFCHDSAYAKYTGTQMLRIEHCTIIGTHGNYAIRFDSQGVGGARVELTLIDNIFKNDNVKNADSLLSVRNNGGNGKEENWMQLKNYYLTSESKGNNITSMNH